MADQKKDPRSGELIFRTDINRRESARYRYWRHVADQQKAAKQSDKKASKKRAAADIKGSEGQKQSKPGGYARTPFNQPSSKKKRKV
jgi:hypothetical protein